jgi:hypothetical protein
MSIDHKTLFAFASWGIFATLLIGRHAWGWRGKRALRWTLAGLLCSSWPTSVAALSLKPFSVAFEPWMTSPVGTFADAGSSVSHVRLFLAQRNGDDGLQSLSPAPPGTIRPPWRPKALRCWRVPTDAGVILLGNNLVNSAAATLVSVIAIALFGRTNGFSVSAPWLSPSPSWSFPRSPRNHRRHLCGPACRGPWPSSPPAALSGCLVHQPVCQRFPQSTAPIPETGGRSQQAVPEELRSLVLESSHLIPQKHHAILSSLFELNTITVEDVMTPRGNIEILDLEQPWEDVKNQLATSHHSRLPTCRESLDQLVGILPVRRLLASLGDPGFDLASLLEQLQPPYYIPARTPVFSQLAFFQENRQRIGFVVDEYGDILGLLTMEDIIEEFVGDFTTSLPGLGQELHWSDEGEAIAEGSRPCVTSTACSASTFRWTAPKPSTV